MIGMPRPCTVCADPNRSRAVAEAVARGETDTAIGAAVGVSRMAVMRHRKAHIEEPARVLVAAASKGRDAAEQRADVIAAAQRGDLTDPMVYLGLSNIVADLLAASSRLERMAQAAEAGGQATAVSSLAGQQIRAIETRARLGQVGGFAPPKASIGEGAQVVINYNFSGGKRETITATVVDAPADSPALAAIEAGYDESAFDHLGPMSPALARLAAARRFRDQGG